MRREPYIYIVFFSVLRFLGAWESFTENNEENVASNFSKQQKN